MDTQTIVACWTLGVFRGEELPDAATARARRYAAGLYIAGLHAQVPLPDSVAAVELEGRVSTKRRWSLRGLEAVGDAGSLTTYAGALVGATLRPLGPDKEQQARSTADAT